MKSKLIVAAGIIAGIAIFYYAVKEEPAPKTPPQKIDLSKLPKNSPLRSIMEAMNHIYPPSVKPESLPNPNSEGAALYREFCTRCHGLFNPKMHTVEEWKEISVAMFKRIDKLYNSMGMLLLMKQPTTSQRAKIVEYLTSHPLKHIDSNSVPEPESAGAKLFVRVCSQCHLLPDFSFHKGGEWKDVVARMRKNMHLMEKKPVSDEDSGAIIEYLARHSS
ncbi:MAG: cytochrome c [Nitrospinae bacterium]|nr:cytochrome c [Nitrospinota bacterium]